MVAARGEGGGMRGCSGGHVWLLGGVCLVALGGGEVCVGYDEIRRYDQ